MKLQVTMQSAPFRVEKLNWLRSLFWSIGVEIPPNLKNGKAIECLEGSLQNFIQLLDGRGKAQIKFGPLVYDHVPTKLPRKEVAIALYLADQVSIWRRDGENRGNFHYPHQPHITKNLPWKAIAQFASPPNSDPDDFLNPDNVQKLVSNQSRRILSVTVPPKIPE